MRAWKLFTPGYGVLEKEICCVLLTYVIKRVSEIRKFYVAVVQQRLRSVQKSMMHIQSFSFANLNLLLFAVAKTPYCCDPEIWLPWCDVTPLLSIIPYKYLWQIPVIFF